jgi:hypothetical protein
LRQASEEAPQCVNHRPVADRFPEGEQHRLLVQAAALRSRGHAEHLAGLGRDRRLSDRVRARGAHPDLGVAGFVGVIAFVIFMTAATIGFIAFVRKKTDGEWRWRWGQE